MPETSMFVLSLCLVWSTFSLAPKLLISPAWVTPEELKLQLAELKVSAQSIIGAHKLPYHDKVMDHMEVDGF